ncbi:hypothetical protein ALP41_200156 [Pseudomonas savastanoi pv. nerii]|nr:hypothetical protein ALP41_200156 [Pseudomonas savastanoi pv. nerii]
MLRLPKAFSSTAKTMHNNRTHIVYLLTYQEGLA